MPKQKKDKKSDDYFSKVHYSGLSLVNPRTGEEFPLEKKWITDLKNLAPEQKKSFREKMIQINKELTEEWKKESKK